MREYRRRSPCAGVAACMSLLFSIFVIFAAWGNLSILIVPFSTGKGGRAGEIRRRARGPQERVYCFQR